MRTPVEKIRRRRVAAVLLGLAAGVLAGCAKEPPPDDGKVRVVLQTDWFAQPEHGGYYQALAKGYYAEAGLAVEILQGGPNAAPARKVVRGEADFALGRIDDLAVRVDAGLPLVAVMADLQHDPLGIMVHESHPARSIADLDDRRVVAVPWLAWVRVVPEKLGITLEIVPSDYGVERFMRDPSLAQQCYVTNEPFFLGKRGVPVRSFLIAETGFDPPHVLYCRADREEFDPDLVAAFVEASRRGWIDYLTGDPAPAHELIARANPVMADEPELMDYVRSVLLERGLVSAEDFGRLDRERIARAVDDLVQAGILEKALPVKRFATGRFIPGETAKER